jgi:hypothetical protein
MEGGIKNSIVHPVCPWCEIPMVDHVCPQCEARCFAGRCDGHPRLLFKSRQEQLRRWYQ